MRNIFIACIFTSIGLIPRTGDAQLAADTSSKLDALFAGWAQDEPGGVLEITRNGEKIFRKVFGVTNLEQPTPITGNTIFVAASVTKQFTAAGILLLVKEGKLGLNDDVHEYIPELPDYGQKITIRQLLTHTSGLRDWWNVTYITSAPSGKRVFDQPFALQYIIRQSGLNYIPGQRYSYTNTGYDLAAVIIERLTGLSYQEYISKRLLEPAGMKQSFIRGRFNQVVPHMASGYIKSEGQYQKADVLNETYGAAGLLTNPHDLAKWNDFIFNSSTGKSIQLLREARFVLNNGDTIPYANGGINIRWINGIKEITHSGLEGGFRSLCTYYPEKGLSVTYMSNNKAISTVQLNKDISEIFFGKDTKSDILKNLLAAKNKNKKSGKLIHDNESLKNKTGVFLNIIDESDFLKLHEHNGRLMSYAAVLTPLTQDVFQYANNIYQFVPGKDTVKLYRSGKVNTYYRVEMYHPSEGALSAFAGTYFSRDANVTLEVKKIGGRLIAFRPEGDSVNIYPVFQLNNSFAFRGFDHGLRATYFFHKKGTASGNSLIISLPRASGIPFKKLNKTR